MYDHVVDDDGDNNDDDDVDDDDDDDDDEDDDDDDDDVDDDDVDDVEDDVEDCELQDGDVEDDPRYGTAMKAAPGCRTKQKLANVKKTICTPQPAAPYTYVMFPRVVQGNAGFLQK